MGCWRATVVLREREKGRADSERDQATRHARDAEDHLAPGNGARRLRVWEPGRATQGWWIPCMQVRRSVRKRARGKGMVRDCGGGIVMQVRASRRRRLGARGNGCHRRQNKRAYA